MALLAPNWRAGPRATREGATQGGMAESSTQRKTSTHDAATLVQLEEQVARLSRRIETGFAHVQYPPNTQTGDEGQRRSSRRSRQPRRNSGMVEDLTRQVQQLTDSLAETDAAMEEQKQRSRQLRYRSVGFMLALSYADLISDLVLAVVLLRGAQAAYGVVAFVVILSVSLVVQVLLVKFLGVATGISVLQCTWQY
jgi:hypothetical protein